MDQDYEEAIEWYQKAGSKHNYKAEYYLGKMYYSGKGCNKDYDKALECFKKGAKRLEFSSLLQLIKIKLLRKAAYIIEKVS